MLACVPCYIRSMMACGSMRGDALIKQTSRTRCCLLKEELETEFPYEIHVLLFLFFYLHVIFNSGYLFSLSFISFFFPFSLSFLSLLLQTEKYGIRG